MLRTTRRLKFLFAGILIAFMSATLAVQADEKPSSLVVFGDSLSDPGNAWVLTGLQSRAPFSLVPDAAYAIGGHHFTNGKTWVEQLAHEFKSNAGPAFRFTGQDNYAVGGARARTVGTVDLEAQVLLHLGMQEGRADPDTLYIIMIGGNDVRDAMQVFPADPSGMQSGVILMSALDSVYQNISSLAHAGAKHFLIATAPDLALVPAVRALGAEVQYLANYFSNQFNNGLSYKLFMLKNQFDIDVTVLDLFAILHQAVATPEEYGFDVVDTACINPGVVARATCSDPNDYLFWDGIHPTRAGHGMIARHAQALLDAAGAEMY
ncbi:MAG: SGNH/GDSL hydrolase family protein [Proteobacteria bacterium]|nr:SGNH/GDSL hydrolase family protein [Pseudomonadota bacterium]